MKKDKLLKSLMLVLLLTSCNSSKESSNDNSKFENIVNQNVDATFRFDSNLKEEGKVYPLSTGRVFYVSNEGQAGNDGLSESAPLRFRDVRTMDFQPGDNILFKCGEEFKGSLTFTNIGGSDDNPITFASYGEGAKPIITSRSDVLIFNECSNIVLRDLHIKVEGLDRLEYPSNVRNGIIFSYKNVGDLKSKNIYICDNKVEGNGVSYNLMGISIQGEEKTHATTPSDVLTNCFINGNEVFNMGRSGIRCSGWVTNDNINNNQGKLTYYRNFHVDNNVVHDVGCMGVYIAACTNSTMNRNLIYNTGIYDKNQGMEGECGIMALSCDTCEIKFNECYDIYDQKTGWDAMGIDIDWNTTNINVQYNYIHDTQGSGIGTMANQNSFIRNNRIEGADCATNHTSSIQVTNYTSKYEAVPADWHSVKNLSIADNLVIHDLANKNVFGVKNSNGDIEFEGNEYVRNHNIFTGDNVNDLFWVNVDPQLPWYKFAENKWYSKDTSKFRCLESTDVENINSAEGAKIYENAKNKNFNDWAKRDTNATYELLSNEIPANPKDVKVKYENEELKFEWKVNSGDIWHFNIYEVKDNEEVEYRNMIGEAFTTSFTYKPTYSGKRYYIIQPESNQGIYGKALKVEVNL